MHKRADEISVDMPEFWAVIENEPKVGCLKAKYTHDTMQERTEKWIKEEDYNL